MNWKTAAPPARRRRVVIAALLFSLGPAAALAQIPTQVVEYYHTDALGSVRAVTKQVNGTWQVVARHDFMPFGEEVAPPSPPRDKRLFTGKERDNETGLDYFEARYLGAVRGQFTTVDPLITFDDNLADPQRWNRYAYARTNPLKYVDRDGRAPAIVKLSLSSKETYERNAQARAIASTLNEQVTGKLGAALLDSLILSPLLPVSAEEEVATASASVMAMAMPLEMPALGAASVRGGETAAAAAGRQAHLNYGTALGEAYDTKVILPSGRKPDAVNWASREVRELKPDNSRAVQRGWSQVKRYRDELDKLTGKVWQAIVDVYTSGGSKQ